jgi:hypothetical protein
MNDLKIAVSLCQVFYGKMWWREKILKSPADEKKVERLLDELAVLTRVNAFPRVSLEKLTEPNTKYAEPFLEKVGLPTYGQYVRKWLREKGVAPSKCEYVTMLERHLNGVYPELLALELLLELDKIFYYAKQ